MQGREIKIKDLHTSDKNASSDSPPKAFFSAASSYGIPVQGLQFKTIKYQITLARFLMDIQTREMHKQKNVIARVCKNIEEPKLEV